MPGGRTGFCRLEKIAVKAYSDAWSDDLICSTRDTENGERLRLFTILARLLLVVLHNHFVTLYLVANIFAWGKLIRRSYLSV